ncbi:MAG: hypothetical protein MUE97_08220 [Phycisphaerales bacterium]|jgi:hypothetical protein|nr:hypothetical protein [Phycisphaerales bacterium]
MRKRKQIVLVTGAGASYDLTKDRVGNNDAHWFPLGNQLPDRISHFADEIVRDISELAKQDGGRDLDLTDLRDNLLGLTDRLRTRYFETLDQFVGMNEPESSTAAYAAAYVIGQAEAWFVRNVRSIPGWLLPVSKAWVRSVSAPDVNVPIVRFVTFNYEQSIEWGLALAYQAHHACSIDTATQVASRGHVAHVHGCTNLKHSRIVADASWCLHHARVLGVSRSIRLVDADTGVANCAASTQAVDAARSWLLEADAIGFIGFGFHRSCLATLGITPSKDVVWTNTPLLLTSWHGQRPATLSIERLIGRSITILDNPEADVNRDLVRSIIQGVDPSHSST